MAKPRKIPAGLYASFAHMSTDQITAYLDKQGIAVTQSWADLWESANAHAKTIVGETRVNIMAEVFNGITDGVKQGKGSRITAKHIAEALAQKGWYYGDRGGAIQALGLDDKAQKQALRGSVRRLKIIARQNMQSAYMAGRWQRFNDNRDNRPFIQYVAVRDESSRPPHAAQHGRVYHIDDPIWDVMWPPNGFNCRCRVRALSQGDIDERGLTVSEGDITKEDIPVKNTDEAGDSQLVKYRYRVGAKGSEQTMNVDAGFGYNGGKVQATPFVPQFGDITADNVGLLKRVAESDKILPDNLSAEAYAAAFLAEFGVKRSEVKHFTDAAGEVIPISEDLLTRREQGKPEILKASKEGRGRYMKLLAQTFKDPDEIWLTWENEKGKWVLKRHYLRVIDLGNNLFALGVFKREKGVWYGSTIFQSNTAKSRAALIEYLGDKRKGLRLYQRQ